MERQTLAILASSLIATAAAMGNPFFAFDNGLGKKSPSEQAALLKGLGYDGIGYSGTGNFTERKKAFDAPGFLKSLGEAGYTGPVGLQCFQVPGAPEDHLKRSIIKWKEIQSLIAEPVKP